MCAETVFPAAGGAGPTPGPYRRQGHTVYVLQDRRNSRGHFERCNLWTAQVQLAAECTEAEAEAVAELFRSAPDLAARVGALEATLLKAQQTIAHGREMAKTALCVLAAQPRADLSAPALKDLDIAIEDCRRFITSARATLDGCSRG